MPNGQALSRHRLTTNHSLHHCHYIHTHTINSFSQHLKKTPYGIHIYIVGWRLPSSQVHRLQLQCRAYTTYYRNLTFSTLLKKKRRLIYTLGLFILQAYLYSSRNKYLKLPSTKELSWISCFIRRKPSGLLWLHHLFPPSTTLYRL